MSDTTPPGRGKQAGRITFQLLAKICKFWRVWISHVVVVFICFLDLPRLIIWMDFSNSMPGKPGKPAFVEFRTRFGRNFVQCPHGLAVDGKCMIERVRASRSANAFGTKRERETSLKP